MLTPLKRIRMEKGIPQWKLAQKIGICPQELSNYEVGRRKCPQTLWRKLARALGCEIKDLELFPE